MKKILTAIALTLTFGILTLAKTHHPEQQESQGKVAYDTDAWRHFLLHAATMNTPALEDPNYADGLAIVTTARRFRAEFEKAIDEFNAAQETRLEADQLDALKSFLVQRDAMVTAYRSELLSALTPQRRTWFDEEILSLRAKSANAGPTKGRHCGLPDHTTCTITYTMFEPSMGEWDGGHAYHVDLNADHSLKTEWNQILDGAAAMAGNPEHPRHTPTLLLRVGVLAHTDSGNSVCENCYLYVNSTVSIVQRAGQEPVLKGEGWQPFAGGDAGTMGTAGTVICSETGNIFDTEEHSEVVAVETRSE